MVVFALTRAGYDEIQFLALEKRAAVWVNKGVLSDREIMMIRERGIQLTEFAIPVDYADSGQMEDVLRTISEHHPNERIWVETQAKA